MLTFFARTTIIVIAHDKRHHIVGQTDQTSVSWMPTQTGGKMSVSHELADRVKVYPAFQQMGGKRMAQTVNTALFDYACAAFGGMKQPLRRLHVNLRAVVIFKVKQPCARMHGAPVQSQRSSSSCGSRLVRSFAPLPC